MRGIILEGITGSGKSALLRALLRRWAETRRGPLWIATEHVTERVLEPLAGASAVTALAQLEAHLAHLARLAEWDADAPRGPATEALFALERFHFSVSGHIPGLADHEWGNLEDRLRDLGTTLVWCRLPPEAISARAVQDTRRQRAATWARWLDTLGNTDEERAEHFRHEQEHLAGLVARSRLPVIELVLCDPSPEDGLQRAVDRIEQSLSTIG